MSLGRLDKTPLWAGGGRWGTLGTVALLPLCGELVTGSAARLAPPASPVSWLLSSLLHGDGLALRDPGFTAQSLLPPLHPPPPPPPPLAPTIFPGSPLFLRKVPPWPRWTQFPGGAAKPKRRDVTDDWSDHRRSGGVPVRWAHSQLLLVRMQHSRK